MSESTPGRSALTLITGPSRSGKTGLALELAAAYPPPRIYLATAQALDEEMSTRIRRHREERGGDYHTVEEPFDLSGVLRSLPDSYTVVIIDCLTLWLSNLLGRWPEEEGPVEEKNRDLIRLLKTFPKPVVIISNEVGWGIVPENPLARKFRDLSGRTNQAVAASADRVILTVAGLPLFLKGSPDLIR